MIIQNQKSYVLHTRDYRESSQLVDLFSRDFGRLRVVAKGVRGKRSSGGNKLRPFTPLLVSWKGKSELKNLTLVEPYTINASLQGEMLYVGLYLNELLVRLLPEHVPHENLFDGYSTLINDLRPGSDPEPLLRCFELELLNDIGYGLNLTMEMSEGREIVPGKLYCFIADQGFVNFHSLMGYSKDICFKGEQLLAMAREDYQCADVRKNAKRLLRIALKVHLGERPLLSRQLFRQIQIPAAVGDARKSK